MEKDKIYRCFEDRNVLEQVIYLDDVKDGTYQIKIQRINEQNGSILGIWQDLDFCMNLTREEVKYFRKVCEPRLMIQTCRIENHSIEVRLKLEPNEIVLVKIDEAV